MPPAFGRRRPKRLNAGAHEISLLFALFFLNRAIHLRSFFRFFFLKNVSLDSCFVKMLFIEI